MSWRAGGAAASLAETAARAWQIPRGKQQAQAVIAGSQAGQASLGGGGTFQNTKQNQKHDNTITTSTKLLRKCKGLFLDSLLLCSSCWLRLMHHHSLLRNF